MSNLSKEFDKVFKDLRTDPYASEAETDALIKPDPRGPAEKRLHTMMDERGAWEQGAESFSVLRDIALELLTEQIKASTNDRRTKACLMACEGVSTEDLEAVMVNTGPLLKNKLAEVDLLRAANANLRAQPAVQEPDADALDGDIDLFDDARSILEIIVHDQPADLFRDARALIPKLRARIGMPPIINFTTPPAQPAPTVQAVAYTTGHCIEKAKPGGCPLHNLHCKFPACDRKES
jgi:hypothetical protein